jgi:hypothetical protein
MSNSRIKSPPSQTSGAIAARKHLALMKEAGLKRIVVWVHPDRVDELKVAVKPFRRASDDVLVRAPHLDSREHGRDYIEYEIKDGK